MKKYILSIFTIMLIFTSFVGLFAQADFEGKIKFKISSDGDEMFLDYFIKGENLRMEMGDNAEAVFLKSKDKSLILMPSEKMYMDLNNSIMSKLSGMAGMNNDENDEEEKDFNIEDYKTGKTARQEDVDTGENVQLSTYALLDEEATIVSYLSVDSSNQRVETKSSLSRFLALKASLTACSYWPSSAKICPLN